MNRKMKSVGMWLLLGSLSTGMAYADLSKNESEIDIVQQSGICQGIVKDATGESVIGASVIELQMEQLQTLTETSLYQT